MMRIFPDGEAPGTETALAFCRAEPYLAGKDDMSLHGLYNTVKRKLIRDKRKEHREAQPLRIEGCRTHLTPEPDDAELAAQALLESIVSEECRVKSEESHARAKADTHHDAAYYRDLAERIREAHVKEARRAKRYLAYAEEKLRTGGQLVDIERGLYPLQDCIEREGGELKRRWQHVLAEVIVRQMNAAGEDDGEEGEGKGGAAMASQQTEPASE